MVDEEAVGKVTVDVDAAVDVVPAVEVVDAVDVDASGVVVSKVVDVGTVVLKPKQSLKNILVLEDGFAQKTNFKSQPNQHWHSS